GQRTRSICSRSFFRWPDAALLSFHASVHRNSRFYFSFAICSERNFCVSIRIFQLCRKASGSSISETLMLKELILVSAFCKMVDKDSDSETKCGVALLI